MIKISIENLNKVIQDHLKENNDGIVLMVNNQYFLTTKNPLPLDKVHWSETSNSSGLLAIISVIYSNDFVHINSL